MKTSFRLALKAFRATLFASLILACAALNAPAADESDDDEQTPKDLYDFVAILKTSRLDQLTNYRASRLKPLGQVAVSYKAHSRSNKDQVLASTPYEDLWYHDYTPIGCRRYRQMPPECTGFGAIRVLPSNDAAEFPGAIANAVIRLLIDMNVHGCACQNVIIPRDIFGSVFSAFSHFGFYEVTSRPETVIPGRITLTLLSDPPGDSKRVYYHEPQN